MWIIELTKTFERQNPTEPDMNANNTSATTQEITGFTSINYGEKTYIKKILLLKWIFIPLLSHLLSLPVFNISLFPLRLPKVSHMF